MSCCQAPASLCPVGSKAWSGTGPRWLRVVTASVIDRPLKEAACPWRDTVSRWQHPTSTPWVGVSETLGGHTRDYVPPRLAG